MNTRLTEFQRVNGDEDNLLPLYITNETKEPNKNIISKRTATHRFRYTILYKVEI
jgi:hypothetical protein